MKKTVFFVLLCTLMLSACKVSFGDGRRIAPDGKIVKKEYLQPAFEEVDVDVVANVKFIQGKDEDYRVVLSAPENYVDLFRFEVKDRELDVKFKKSVNIEAANVDITVYAPILRKLENEGVANVEIDRLTADELDVENSGVGSMFLSGLVVGRLNAECSGVGSMELKGEAERADLKCSGVGSIKAEKLTAKSVKAIVSGVGGINCYATESIKGDVSGVGSLKYGGNPQEKNLSRSGVGGISEL